MHPVNLKSGSPERNLLGIFEEQQRPRKKRVQEVLRAGALVKTLD